MVGRYPGKDRAVAQGLSKLFGRDDAWGLQVVGASPCVLLHDLSSEQAQVVSDSLIDIENLGCQMDVQEGVDEGLPKVNWPAPARIRGRLVTEMTAPAVPISAAQAAASPTQIHVPQQPQQVQHAQIPQQLPQTATLSLLVPCPYTGQKIKLTLQITVAREGNTTTISASGTSSGMQSVQAPMVVPAPASQRPPSRPNVLPAYGQINTPIASPAVKSPPSRLTPKRPPPIPAPTESNEPVIHGLENLDGLVPLPSGPRPQMPVQRQSPGAPRGGQMARPTSQPHLSIPKDVVPLPDVPVIHGQNGQGFGDLPGTPVPAPMPKDLLGAPMDLEQFEAKVSASGIMRAVQPEQAGSVFGEDSGGEQSLEDDAVCSVFMGKNNNPRVHQLVAELHGISVAEATRYCQKPIVALAKEISANDAQELRQRFAAVNVTVRITKRK